MMTEKDALINDIAAQVGSNVGNIPEYAFKTLLLGARDVGKSSVGIRFVKNTFSDDGNPQTGMYIAYARVTRHLSEYKCIVRHSNGACRVVLFEIHPKILLKFSCVPIYVEMDSTPSTGNRTYVCPTKYH